MRHRVLSQTLNYIEPWLSRDQLDKMDDEHIRGYVHRVMKSRAREDLAKAMSNWGVGMKQANDLWSSYEQAVGWISPHKWKPVLENKEVWNGMISGTVAVMKAHFHAFWGTNASIANRWLWVGLTPDYPALKTHIQMLVDQSDPANLGNINHEDLIIAYGIKRLYEFVPQRRSTSDAPRPKASRRNDSFSSEPRKHQKTKASSDGRHASREPIVKEKKGGSALSDGLRGASSSSAIAAADVPGRAALRMTELVSVAASISSRGSTPPCLRCRRAKALAECAAPKGEVVPGRSNDLASIIGCAKVERSCR